MKRIPTLNGLLFFWFILHLQSCLFQTDETTYIDENKPVHTSPLGAQFKGDFYPLIPGTLKQFQLKVTGYSKINNQTTRYNDSSTLLVKTLRPDSLLINNSRLELYPEMRRFSQEQDPFTMHYLDLQAGSVDVRAIPTSQGLKGVDYPYVRNLLITGDSWDADMESTFSEYVFNGGSMKDLDGEIQYRVLGQDTASTSVFPSILLEKIGEIRGRFAPDSLNPYAEFSLKIRTTLSLAPGLGPVLEKGVLLLKMNVPDTYNRSALLEEKINIESRLSSVEVVDSGDPLFPVQIEIPAQQNGNLPLISYHLVRKMSRMGFF